MCTQDPCATESDERDNACGELPLCTPWTGTTTSSPAPTTTQAVEALRRLLKAGFRILPPENRAYPGQYGQMGYGGYPGYPPAPMGGARGYPAGPAVRGYPARGPAVKGARVPMPVPRMPPMPYGAPPMYPPMPVGYPPMYPRKK